MKKYLFLLIVGYALVGCNEKKDDVIIEPVGVGYHIWQNDSDHRINIIEYEGFTIDGEKLVPDEQARIIQPGESIVRREFNIAIPPAPHFYNDIELIFDDGPYGGVYPLSRESVSSYDVWWGYNYEEGELFMDGTILCRRWTYTFTNADFDAAVARGPMTEQ